MTDTDPSHVAQLSILKAALPIAAFEGWTSKTLRDAIKSAGFPDGADELYFPGGAVELITFWADQSNTDAEAALETMDLAAMKIRERVTAGVIARLETIGRHDEAARRAMAKLSLPSSGTAGPKTLWSASDMVWRAIGDTSTDMNFYSKRTVLSAVISSTLPIWLSDKSEGKAEARAFLDRRIENVMQFEKVKAKARKAASGFPDPVKALSKLRYGRPRRWRR